MYSNKTKMFILGICRKRAEGGGGDVKILKNFTKYWHNFTLGEHNKQWKNDRALEMYAALIEM